jgi:amidohydrolase
VKSEREAIKKRIDERLELLSPQLIELSHRIHAHPELGFAEHRAHDWLCEVLEGAGLSVERSAFAMPTAFAARAGSDGPLIAILCEYDALPEIGHGCGHNVIAAAGAGAALVLAELAEQLGGRLLVLGTPAEEGGGGKILLARAGAFEGVQAVLMVHPADVDFPTANGVALAQLEVEYEGRAAHAAAAPWLGRNALDAAVLGYQNVAALRQHIGDAERVHGIFTHGGDIANIVPHRAATQWFLRSPTMRELDELRSRVLACLRAGALAAECSIQERWVDPVFADVVHNGSLLDVYAVNSARAGRPLPDRSPPSPITGSTDLGHVSHLVPAITPLVKVAPEGTALHSAEFAHHAGGEMGDRAVLDGAKAMAMSAVDLWLDPETLAHAWREHLPAGPGGSSSS